MPSINLSVRDMLSPSLLKAASPDTLRRALEAGATVLARDARLSWKEPGRRPGPWAPLAASTIKRKGHDKILYDTGRLRDSITLGEVTPASATAGTDATYSIYHQLGTKSMAARPFIPVNGAGQLTAQTEAEIAAAMEEALRSAVVR